ncbi:MAG: DEAD/DEAH box helicase family protein, partial [Sphaerochaetaceae bacterium]
MLSFDEQLLRSLNSAFIQSGGSLEDPLSPALVLNDPPRQKILGTLRNEITHCCSFDFSVAFITNEAIHMLLEELLEAKERKVQGRILTTDYLSFTDPNALTTLITKFPNIQVRIYTGAPFHAKGFIFYHDTASQIASVIIGSANLTAKALCETRELAVRFIAKKEGALLQDVQKEFSCSWQKGTEATLDWVEAYKKCRKSYLQVAIDKVQQDREETSLALVNPNSMQREALASLAQLRAQGARKALLISATGTGKTYLSALDVKAFKPRRCLFIVHRERILKDAMKSFKQILGEQYQYGLLTGSNKNTHAQFLFASIQTLSQENILSLFDRYAFDYIIVDEVQHSGGATYQQVLSHFSAQFLLGMTATPERMDGFDIYSLFDHNITYEIRLQQAMEQKLLCPFHYFGITDISVQGQEIDDLASFRNLLSEQRVQWIVNILDKYSPCGIPRKGLFFCSRIEEAQELSKALNEHNLRTRALSGFDNDTSRLEAIQDLEQGKLEYILTVDIFNEGVDIPFLNQVVMLRPTKSVVVFVQQLGRGLRKCPSKEFLTVIDFIGNYRNNYMIPIALYGDNSGQKESIRKLVGGDSVSLAGTSTISFDEIARKKIYDSIASTSYPDLKMLKNAYTSVSQQLGRTPTMVDYTKVDSISPLLFLEKEPSYA